MIILDMPIPKSCWECRVGALLTDCPYFFESCKMSDYLNSRHPDCPIQVYKKRKTKN